MIPVLLATALAAGPVVDGAAAPALPVEGTAWRMSTPDAPWRDGHQLHVFEGADDCRAHGVRDEDLGACRPWIDPRRREVRLSVGVLGGQASDAGPSLVPVALVDADARPNGRLGAWMLKDVADVQLVPHVARDYRQLFVLLVDRTKSMYDVGPAGHAPMQDVVGVLLSDGVQQAFFPGGGRGDTGVLLLGFTTEVTGPDGGPWQAAPILTDAAAYDAAVRGLLVATNDYTDLYGAVTTVVDDVLVQPSVRDFVTATQGDPALVVLTQGFHDPGPTVDGHPWTCRDNVAPLRKLVARLDELADVAYRPVPVLSVVGLGDAAWPSFSADPSGKVDERQVCGDEADAPIDGPGGLEARGVDNRSLELLSLHGRGRQAYFQRPDDLARFLAHSAPVPHDWYEVRMRLDPDRPASEGGEPDAQLRHRFRAPMPFRLRLRGVSGLDASVTLFPHPWWDAAPPSGPDAARWGAVAGPLGPLGLWVQAVGLVTGLFGAALGLRRLRRAWGRKSAALGARD